MTLIFLRSWKKSSFPKFQQSNRRAIRYSISSPFQKVFIAEKTESHKRIPTGSATVYIFHKKTLRLFSIAVLPQHKGNGIGKLLLEYIIQMARLQKFERVSLEVRKSEKRLIKYYEDAGFKVTEELPGYYSPSENGFRMVLSLEENGEKQSTSNIIIVRNPKNWNLEIEGVKVISSRSYMTDPEFQSLKNVRIFNLSNSYQYQKMGYYVSLLASARDHRIIPNVATLRDFFQSGTNPLTFWLHR